MATLTTNAVDVAAEADSLWESRVRRLRDLARHELRRVRALRRVVDLDDIVQDALVAWLKGGVARHEYVSPAALAVVRERIASATAAGQPRSVAPRRLDVIACSPVEGWLDLEDERDLVEAVNELPARLRLLARARMFGSRPLPGYSAVARAMGCTVSNASRHCLRTAELVVQKIRHKRAMRSVGVWTAELETLRRNSDRSVRSIWVKLPEGRARHSLADHARERWSRPRGA